MAAADDRQYQASEMRVLLEEFRTLNRSMKDSAEHIARSIGNDAIDKGKIEYHAKELYEATQFMTVWLDVVDFEYNPAFKASQRTGHRSLYNKFRKGKQIFERITKTKKVQIVLDGDASAKDTLIECYEMIDLIPFLLISNAIKYSPEGGKVNIWLGVHEGRLKVSSSNVGPTVDADEIALIGKKSVRGRNAVRVSNEGAGIGLYLLELICDAHGANLKYSSRPSHFSLHGIPYSEFSASIEFPRSEK